MDPRTLPPGERFICAPCALRMRGITSILVPLNIPSAFPRSYICAAQGNALAMRSLIAIYLRVSCFFVCAKQIMFQLLQRRRARAALVYPIARAVDP